MLLLRQFTRARVKRAATLSSFAAMLILEPLRAEPVQGAPIAAPASGEKPPAGLDPPAPFEVGVPVRVAVEGDRPLLVMHAPAHIDRPIIYLHGLCGNVRAVESWKAAATAHGSLIVLLGDRPCGGGRFRWGKRLDIIESRIERALAAVQRARAGRLDARKLVLFGYSQGAAKAEALAAHDAQRYRRVVLGGAPTRPNLVHLGGAQAVAVFGGELEATDHMRAGADLLAAAGKPVRFFLLPAAKHGEYGPDGNRVMGELFSWLLAEEAADTLGASESSALGSQGE